MFLLVLYFFFRRRKQIASPFIPGFRVQIDICEIPDICGYLFRTQITQI